jgi:hypothetical protein
VTTGLGSILLLLGATVFAQNSRIDGLKAQYDGTYSAPEEQSSFNQNA